MINIDYVNGSIALETEGLFKPYTKFIESCENEIKDIFVNFNVITEKVELESSIMGSVPENMMMVYEAEKTNIFARIGEFLVKIYNEFVKLIDNVIDKIKNFSFKNKTNVQKLDILVKQHPEFKNEIVAAFNADVLKLDDINKLKELDRAWEEVLKMAKKKDIDTKTLKGKIEKIKENFEKDEKSWKVVKVAAAVGTVVTAAKAVTFFVPQCAEVMEKFKELKKSRSEQHADMMEELRNAKDKDGNPIVTNQTGKFRLLLEFRRWGDKKYATVEKQQLSVFEILQNSIADFLDKFSKKSSEKFKYNLNKTSERKEEQKLKDLENKTKEAAVTAAAQAEARNAVEKKHEDEIRERKAKDAAAQTAAQTEARLKAERQ